MHCNQVRILWVTKDRSIKENENGVETTVIHLKLGLVCICSNTKMASMVALLHLQTN
jgi:hypothetical protein